MITLLINLLSFLESGDTFDCHLQNFPKNSIVYTKSKIR